MIDDLDDPFGGYWRVNAEPWDDLSKDIEDAIASLPTGNHQSIAELQPEQEITNLFFKFIVMIARLRSRAQQYVPFQPRKK
jgi:hypothetical protein